MGDAMKQAEQGLALFQKDSVETKTDTAAAAAFKISHEAAIKVKEDRAATLTGKDNKKERSAVAKEASDLKADPKYVDACKIAKDLPPPNGNFITTVAPKKEEVKQAAPAKEEVKVDKKDKEKPKKATESAGISKAERDELEDLKKKLITRKGELKAEGKSGGECNKDAEVVEMVKRMTELKIKEDPSLADADKSKGKDKKKNNSDKSADKSKLEGEIEEYRQKLISDFQYTKKDIAADPDMMEMQTKLKQMK